MRKRPAGITRNGKETARYNERGRAKALPLFAVRENPFLFFYISFLSGEGAIRRMYLCCVYVTIQERAQEEGEKVSVPVVRNKRWRVTVGNRKLGSPSGDKNAA